MSLQILDSFDHYSTTTAAGKWANNPSGSGVGRTGNYMGFSTTVNTKNLQVGRTEVILGAAFQWQGGSIPLAGVAFVYFREGSINHVTFGLNGTGFLILNRDTTPIATAITLPLTVSNWYYLEFKVVIHDTTGSVEVRVDGTAVTWNTSVTNIDTRTAGGTGVIDNVGFRGNSTSPFTMVDDMYVVDTNGGAPWNTFLGPIKVEALVASSGNGTHTGLTPSTGTDHGALVDENPPNTTDYNSGSTAGVKDTYNLPSMTLTGTILGVQTNMYANKSDAGARWISSAIRVNGTDYDGYDDEGTEFAPITTFQHLSTIWEKSPDTDTTWTSSEINGMEAGMKIRT